MKKNEYLNSPDLIGFINFIKKVIEGDIDIDHRFTVVDPKTPPGYEKCVQINVLEDAFDKYFWDRGDYRENARKLAKVREALIIAYKDRSENRNSLMINGISECMRWGLGKLSSAKANVQWAEIRKENIAELIDLSCSALCSDDPDFNLFKKTLRMNAGYTKVYSLLLDNFIIYDGRVGAAFCYLVKKYCELNSLATIPDLLRFKWAQGVAKSSRNPSDIKYKFDKLNGNGAAHALWNIRANWVVSAALEVTDADWCNGTDSFRRVEAALFMVGYSFKGGSMSIETCVESNDGRMRCNTLGKNNEFSWFYNDKSKCLNIYRGAGGDVMQSLSIALLLSVIDELKLKFGSEYFPLANNVQTIADGSEKDGLGRVLKSLSKNEVDPIWASQLAAIFTKVGLIEWDGSKNKMMFKLVNQGNWSSDSLHDFFVSPVH